ncbi:aldehyde ferredoxin oxidoreductase family protein [[Clostridium] fimetarium]|uniref:Aldehyde:ferredoxin oxidoreductase n=1 Tax=[Clostridium] fimetarium TaxID=99656 RepID=A0A1I0RF21_9FIRM|nr:aldehyde ferredoxin oxidoreductase family protein [[Clostridium] fimetarium]SEW39422.1 aldehyde:ferredoxin oxidoreductase [[Clostridium] fimetarium]
MQTAYNGKTARINLSNGEIKVEKLDIDLAKKFIGGRGLGTKMIYDEGIATVDPLSEQNKLVYITGAMTGTKAPTTGRFMVVTKSPLTGMIASSNSGGVWGAKLKYAGWDAIIVEGKAKTPTYINIVDDKIELLSAQDYVGMKSEEIDEELKKVHEKCSVLNIGPAGEHLSLLAAIMNDKDRAAGRSGVGAVMGSKNLKAITVTATNNSIEAFDPEALKEVTKKSFELIKANGVTGSGLPTYGTAVLVNIINNTGAFPTNNWQQSYYDKADDTSGETLKEKYLVKQSFCHKCPIGCGRVINLNGKVVGGPEYEPLWAYGGNCGISDLNAINEGNYWCNEYGLDAISTPCTIAAAMELYEKGYIKEEECEGVPLKWGSSEAIIEWTKRMGESDIPLAKLMADGSYRLCEYYGHPEFSMSVKKQEMPAYDARAIQGIGITYATSNRGGCHVRGYMISPEILGLPELLDRTKTEGKALWTKIFQDLTAVIDSMGLCLFTSFAIGAPEYANMLNAGTGTNYSPEELLEVGERIYNIERMFNKAAGMKPEDDNLPKRLTDEPIQNGPSEGQTSQIAITLPEYYKVRGWENAFPTQETLERLGLL